MDQPFPPLPSRIPEGATRPTFDPDGRLSCDLPCRRCGYNLRAQMAEGVCPECGAAVAQSLHGDELRFADPVWAAKVLRGITCLMNAMLVASLIAVSAGFVTSVLGFLTVFVLGGGCLLLGLWGLWKFTSPEPSEVADSGEINLRQTVRFSILAGLLPLLLFCVSVRWPALFRDLSLMSATALLAILLLSSLGYSRQISVRASGTDFETIFRALTWGWGILFTILMAEEIKEAFVPPVQPWADGLACFGTMLLLLLVVVSLITGVCFRQAIALAIEGQIAQSY